MKFLPLLILFTAAVTTAQQSASSNSGSAKHPIPLGSPCITPGQIETIDSIKEDSPEAAKADEERDFIPCEGEALCLSNELGGGGYTCQALEHLPLGEGSSPNLPSSKVARRASKPQDSKHRRIIWKRATASSLREQNRERVSRNAKQHSKDGKGRRIVWK